MSVRATRPRSRRGRPAPPGELDPVAESSEEAEAAGSNTRLSAGAVREEARPRLLEPRAGASDQGLGDGADGDADGDAGRVLCPEGPQEPPAPAQQPPEADPADGGAEPTGTGAPDVFHTLQQALSSLEAAVAAWRCRPCPTSPLPEGAGPSHAARAPGCSAGQREAARLSESNAWLRLALDTREAELLRTRTALHAFQAEKETLHQHVQELQETLRRVRSSPPGSPRLAGGPGSDSSSSGADTEPWGARDSSSVSPLLRLRDSSSQILGPVSMPVCGPAEKLLEGRVEQLHGSVEKLKCFNRLLLAVLRGCKGRCEELSLHVGRRAAEATALGLALHYSESCEAAYGALLALREADPAWGTPRPKADLQRAVEEARRLLAAVDGGTPQHSPEGSSADKPQEVATQLQAHIQRLQERQALLKIPPEPSPSAAAGLTAPHGEVMVQAILETQPGPALPQLEKTQIQRGLMATRETLADLMLQLQLVRREKRGLELREAALRAQGPAHVLLLEQLQWERAQLAPAPQRSGRGGGSSGEGSSEEDEAWPQFVAVAPSQAGLPGMASCVSVHGAASPASPTRPSTSSSGSLSTQCPARTPVTSLATSPARMHLLLEAPWPSAAGTDPSAASGSSQTEGRGSIPHPAVRLGPLASLALSPQGLPALPGDEEGRDPEKLSQELAASLARALVLAFRGAHRKQEEQRRKLEQQLALLEARQAEELARLEATARGLAGPRPPRPPPPAGETLL
ncbi:Usher syndrome type-1C protein-binding protein 1 isoform X2 [Dipodomys spectabilis]|uniref:Usher syndrome type-1C protein-binding protein 1 isoform X2 n=1 Tax=Dipodomys spectabilis TaxID=105255 RepID=UPI001C548B98|nr:Usher syndrome type-1C protein-binding protein 1 isoform X2 [Dipodomys spectabilis]